MSPKAMTYQSTGEPSDPNALPIRLLYSFGFDRERRSKVTVTADLGDPYLVGSQAADPSPLWPEGSNEALTWKHLAELAGRTSDAVTSQQREEEIRSCEMISELVLDEFMREMEEDMEYSLGDSVVYALAIPLETAQEVARFQEHRNPEASRLFGEKRNDPVAYASALALSLEENTNVNSAFARIWAGPTPGSVVCKRTPR